MLWHWRATMLHTSEHKWNTSTCHPTLLQKQFVEAPEFVFIVKQSCEPMVQCIGMARLWKLISVGGPRKQPPVQINLYRWSLMHTSCRNHPICTGGRHKKPRVKILYLYRRLLMPTACTNRTISIGGQHKQPPVQINLYRRLLIPTACRNEFIIASSSSGISTHPELCLSAALKRWQKIKNRGEGFALEFIEGVGFRR